MALWFWILLFATVRSQSTDEREQCVQAWLKKKPDLLNRFRRDQLLFMCQRSQNWEEAASSPAAPVSDFLTPKQLAYLAKLRDCQGSDCLKDLDGTDQSIMPATNLRLNTSGLTIDMQSKGRENFEVIRVNPVGQSRQGQPGRALRKEYRTLSEDERRRYHNAIQRLKSEQIDGMSKYDLLVIYHTPQEAPEAHWGPAFLPYHREFLKQYELALRQVDSSIALPYWDSTLDEGLPSPVDSVLWTNEFLGNSLGPVSNGPFAGWTAVQELPNFPGERRLTRQVGVSPYGGLYKPSDVDFILTRNRFDDLTQCIDPTFELTHGIVHSFVGGHMLEINISPNDPAFYMHHAFIDYLWEQFRQTRQNRRQREHDYPTRDRSCNEFHYADAPMKPFPIRILDGLSERYTNELYQYAQRPVCGNGQSCNPASENLFCDTRINRCLSKVQLNGNCTGFDGQDICYKGTCKRGVCVLSDSPITMATDPWTTRYPTTQSTIKYPVPTQNPCGVTCGLPTQPTKPTPTYRPPQTMPTGGQYYFTTTQPTYRPPTRPTGGQYYFTTAQSTYRPPPPTQGSTYRPPPTRPTWGQYYFTTQAPTYRPPPQTANYFTTQTPNEPPFAYITVTVIKGFGGSYGYEHATGANVQCQGLGSPHGYDYTTTGLIYPNTTAPSYVGACLLKIYDPDQSDRQVKFSITASDANGRECKIRCWNDANRRYIDCPRGNVFLVSSNSQNSDPIPYYQNGYDALEKRWSGVGYRRYRMPDYVVFQCM